MGSTHTHISITVYMQIIQKKRNMKKICNKYLYLCFKKITLKM